MIKVFTKNKNGKIELTEKEIKELLDESYWEGYRSANKSYTYISPYPSWWSPYTYNSSSTNSSITITSNEMSTLNTTL